jgi:hypothetical protein
MLPLVKPQKTVAHLSPLVRLNPQSAWRLVADLKLLVAQGGGSVRGFLTMCIFGVR